MPRLSIYSYLVKAGKHLDVQPDVAGTRVSQSQSARLFSMLSDVYSRAEQECNIDISFDHAADGSQQNDCRDILVNHLRQPSISRGKLLAHRLQTVTTLRSGLALFFVLVGDNNRKIVVSRFPADSAILAETREDTLSVQFLERVFMKSATAYKAAVYRGDSYDAGFWVGRAVDKQINSSEAALSAYWIKDFLLSDFLTTDAAGTRRLAIAMRKVTNSPSTLAVKSEIVAAARLARAADGQSISIADFADRFGLSPETKTELKRHLGSEHLYAERFRFSLEEFEQHAAHCSIEMDNGGILIAPSDSFDEVFQCEEVANANGNVRYITEGRILNQKLRKGI